MMATLAAQARRTKVVEMPHSGGSGGGGGGGHAAAGGSSSSLAASSFSPHAFYRPSSSSSRNLQDILRLLTLWFNHGAQPDVRDALTEGFGHVSVDTWLGVLPQIIARIHSL